MCLLDETKSQLTKLNVVCLATRGLASRPPAQWLSALLNVFRLIIVYLTLSVL